MKYCFLDVLAAAVQELKALIQLALESLGNGGALMLPVAVQTLQSKWHVGWEKAFEDAYYCQGRAWKCRQIQEIIQIFVSPLVLLALKMESHCMGYTYCTKSRKEVIHCQRSFSLILRMWYESSLSVPEMISCCYLDDEDKPRETEQALCHTLTSLFGAPRRL